MIIAIRLNKAGVVGYAAGVPVKGATILNNSARCAALDVGVGDFCVCRAGKENLRTCGSGVLPKDSALDRYTAGIVTVDCAAGGCVVGGKGAISDGCGTEGVIEGAAKQGGVGGDKRIANRRACGIGIDCAAEHGGVALYNTICEQRTAAPATGNGAAVACGISREDTVNNLRFACVGEVDGPAIDRPTIDNGQPGKDRVGVFAGLKDKCPACVLTVDNSIFYDMRITGVGAFDSNSEAHKVDVAVVGADVNGWFEDNDIAVTALGKGFPDCLVFCGNETVLSRGRHQHGE